MSKEGAARRLDKLYPTDGTVYLVIAPCEEGEEPHREGNMIVGTKDDIGRFLTPKEKAGSVVAFGITLEDRYL